MNRCPEGRDADDDDDKVALLKSLTGPELMAYVDDVLAAHGGNKAMFGRTEADSRLAT